MTSRRGVSAPARPRGASRIAAIHQSLDRFVRREMSARRVPGVAVGVLHRGREYVKGYGVTNIDHPMPVGSETLFQIGSTTKTFTATVVMRLVEQGKIDLDAHVRRYLRGLKLKDEKVARTVTVRHLLTHTAGWVGDYFDDTGRGDDALARVIDKLAGVPQLTPLGSVWSYNNSAFYMAGRVIEKVTGKPYEQVVKEMVFDPLGMSSSFFFAEEVLTHSFAVGHQVIHKRVRVARPWALPRSAHPAGGIISNVVDQLRYARFHLGEGRGPDGKRVLRKSSMKKMQTKQAEAGGLAEGVGLSWLLRTVGGVGVAAHGGTTNGQLSAFALVPERDFAITVLTNSSTGGQLHGQVVRWALKNYLGLADPEPVALKLPRRELEIYAGRYRTTTAAEIELRVGTGRLVAKITPPQTDGPAARGPRIPPLPFIVYDTDRIVIPEGPFANMRADFIRNPDGSIAWLRFGGRIAARQRDGK